MPKPNHIMVKRFLQATIIAALVMIICCGIFYAQATTSLFAWDTGVGFGLPYYGSVIDADDTMYLSQFSWDATNASSVSFKDVRMGPETPFSVFTVSSDVNVTFTRLDVGELTYSVFDVGTQNFTGVTEPLSVKIDGNLTDSGWSFTGSTLSVEGAASTVDVVFGGSLLTADDAAALAIVFGLIAIAVCVALIMLRRNSNE